MEQIDEKMYITTQKELRTLNASDFKDHDVVNVRSPNSRKIKYCIELKDGGYGTFSLCSRVMDFQKYKYLSCTVGTGRNFTPAYIANFLSR